VGSQRDGPATLPPRKTRYLLYRRLGRPQDRTGRVRKIPPPPGFDPRIVQPIYCIIYPRNPTKLNIRSILHSCIFIHLKLYKCRKRECDIIHTWAPRYQVVFRIWPATYRVWHAGNKDNSLPRRSKEYICLSVTNSNVTLETTLHSHIVNICRWLNFMRSSAFLHCIVFVVLPYLQTKQIHITTRL